MRHHKALRPLTLCIIATASLAHAEPQSISVAQFSQDPAKVAALQKGIAAMKANSSADPTSAQFRTSFAYWANTHGYFGTGKYATNLDKYIARRMPECLQTMTAKQCKTYYAHMQNTPVPNDGVTENIWGTCQHGNLNFLPWHRLYLHFYERTLRKAVGDDQFALPYWNYFDNYQAQQKGLSLPSLVRGDASNPLYDQWRTLGLNDDTNLMDPDSASAKEAFDFDDFTHFSDTLQGQPHGAMHCAVGSGCTAPDIGFVPIAGLDPVFYMHHKNIDRLWQCWLNKKANGQPIDLAWAKANLGMPDEWYNTAYTFMDENGTAVTMTIADVFDPSKIQVNYDNLTNCDAAPPSAPLLMSGVKANQSPLKRHAPLRSIKPITLGSKAQTIKLQAEKMLTAPAPDSPDSPVVGQTYLTLKNVAIQGAPALTYKVYLVNSNNSKQQSYIATINLFGAGDEHHHAHHGDPRQLGSFVYQVSDNLAQIGVTDPNQATVRFEPTNLMRKNTVKQKAGNGLTVESVVIETQSTPPTP